MIGHLEQTVIACPDPGALAQFYCQVLCMAVNADLDDGVVIGTPPGRRVLAFQDVTDGIPPCWLVTCDPDQRGGPASGI